MKRRQAVCWSSWGVAGVLIAVCAGPGCSLNPVSEDPSVSFSRGPDEEGEGLAPDGNGGVPIVNPGDMAAAPSGSAPVTPTPTQVTTAPAVGPQPANTSAPSPQDPTSPQDPGAPPEGPQPEDPAGEVPTDDGPADSELDLLVDAGLEAGADAGAGSAEAAAPEAGAATVLSVPTAPSVPQDAAAP